MKANAFSLREARRIALAAQGFGNTRAEGPASKRNLRSMAEALGVLQIDSVNVLARAHLLPGFARLGHYNVDDLHALSYGTGQSGSGRAFFEYWAHEASLVPLTMQPLLRWRMARAANGQGIYKGLARFGREHQPFLDQVRAELRRRGPLSAAELDIGDKSRSQGKGGWWGWSETKTALEWLFWAGEITTATRRGAFERIYGLTENVLPKSIVDMPTPSEADAIRALVEMSARAMGIGSEPCLRDWYRLDPADSKRAVAELVEEGILLPAKVEGWTEKAFLHKDAKQPRRLTAQALLAPFDPLIWQRERTEGLFGARVRLEIYTPAHKRVHGYYVLPFLLGDRIVARLDLKADRAHATLRVQAAHLEEGEDAARVIEPLRAELHLMRQWLGLEHLAVENKGTLATSLR
jgi:uncharacterized protein